MGNEGPSPDEERSNTGILWLFLGCAARLLPLGNAIRPAGFVGQRGAIRVLVVRLQVALVCFVYVLIVGAILLIRSDRVLLMLPIGLHASSLLGDSMYRKCADYRNRIPPIKRKSVASDGTE